MRQAKIERKTKETEIMVNLGLEPGKIDIQTGIGFLDHMLHLMAFHAGFSLEVQAKGDLWIDDHHTVEDIGIVLGQCLNQALADRVGIARYGSSRVVMDESLAWVDLDFSNRPYLVFLVQLHREKIGELSSEMVKEFFRAVSQQAGLTLHIQVPYGDNDHHQVEAIFKAFGRALKQGVQIVSQELNSSKGLL